ncbi:MAG TPA: hypothetical protein VK809_00940 [Bacteroidia bacterium]|jgi:hypothetical protein|nr:hypothetical protein [Bacteroidia bacterium]
MKKIYSSGIWIFPLFLVATGLRAQNVAINNSGNAAYVSAILDLSNHNTAGTVGFLPPYVTFALPLSNFQISGTAAQSSGMIVYNTGGANPEGLYYWDNTIPSWVAMGSTVSGAGTLNYYARWTPAGNTLGIGFTEDNGTSISMSNPASAPVNTQMLTVTGNATSINGIVGKSTATGGAGVIGNLVNPGVSGGYGVEGLVSGAGGGFQYAVYGSSTITAGNGIGVSGQATGGGAAINYGGYFTASGGASNYGIIVPNNGGFAGLYTTTPVNTLDVFGSFGTQMSTAVLTANTTLDATHSTVLVNPTGGAFTITLPTPGPTNIRRVYTIVYSPSAVTVNAVTIQPTAGSIITNGVSSASITLSGGSVTLQSNGANWYTTGDWTGGQLSGSGTLNYLARWTPNGNTLGIGVTEDNNASVSMSSPASAPVASQMLTVTGNATAVNAITGTTAQATGYGVQGINTSATGTTSGVYGSSASNAGYGVYGTTSNTGGIGVYAINSAPDNIGLPGWGVYSQTSQEGFTENSSVMGIQEGTGYYNIAVQGLADFPYYNTFNYVPTYGAGVFGNGLAEGVVGISPGYFGAGGIGVKGIAAGGGGVNPQALENYGVEGEIGTGGAGVAGFSNSLATWPGAVTTAGTMGLANGAGSTVGAVGINQNVNGVGVAGLGNNIGALTIPATGAGGAFTGNSGGVAAYAKTIASGVGVIGAGNNIAAPIVPAAGAGASFTGVNVGAAGWATTSATATGIVGVGNNLAAYTTYANGSGGAFSGTSVGAMGYGTVAASATGVLGIGNATGATVLATGSGGSFNGTSYGIYARTTAANNPSGAFQGFNTATGNTVYVDYWNGTNYKILGTSPGAVSCSVLDSKGNSVVMHAPETPEAYFEDYGQGQLVNGKVHIDMDPSYSKNICVNDKHPLRVFIQLEGDCKGVYVANKTATGFDVVELNGGTSNITFQYHIIGNQADAVMPSGVVSKFADLRFEPTPKPVETITTDTKSSTGVVSTSVQEYNQPKASPVEVPEPGHTAKIPAEFIKKYKDSQKK